MEEGAINDQMEYVTIVVKLGGLKEVTSGCLKISYLYYS